MFFAVYTVYRTGLSFQSLQTCLLTTEILSGTILVILQSHTHGHFASLMANFPFKFNFSPRFAKQPVQSAIVVQYSTVSVRCSLDCLVRAPGARSGRARAQWVANPANWQSSGRHGRSLPRRTRGSRSSKLRGGQEHRNLCPNEEAEAADHQTYLVPLRQRIPRIRAS
jgi:hypothetical protein